MINLIMTFSLKEIAPTFGYVVISWEFIYTTFMRSTASMEKIADYSKVPT
jgi:hypothetical protein